MRNWNIWLGIMMMLGSIAGGLYFGLWIMFIGGALQIIREASLILAQQPYEALNIGYGMARMLLAGPVTSFVAAMVFIFGAGLAGMRVSTRRK